MENFTFISFDFFCAFGCALICQDDFLFETIKTHSFQLVRPPGSCSKLFQASHLLRSNYILLFVCLTLTNNRDYFNVYGCYTPYLHTINKCRLLSFYLLHERSESSSKFPYLFPLVFQVKNGTPLWMIE